MLGFDAVILVLVIGALLLVAGVPVGVVLAASSSIGFYAVTSNFSAATSLLLSTSYDVTSSISYLVIPMFILMGMIASNTNIVRDLFDAAYRLVGRLSGGIAIAACVASAGFAAVTGSSISSTAAMGKIALPEMRRFNYDLKLSVGAIAASGTFAMMLPPSIVMVFYGIVAEQSIGKLLVAGLIPGMLTVLVYSLQMYVRARLNPALAPKGEVFSRREVVDSIAKSSPFVLLLLVLIGGILTGVWTPTEASAGGVVTVLIIGFFRRKLDLKSMVDAGIETITTTASVFLLLIGSILFSKFLAFSGTTSDIVEFIIAQQMPPFVFFLCLILFYIVLGTFLEAISMIALTVPILLPVVIQLGWDPIWFGVVLIKLIEIGAVTPPVGLNLYALKAVAPEVPMKAIFVGTIPFWLCDIVVLMVLFVIPDIVLFIPNLM